ncbi:MAG: glycosyltransferase [Bryobacteraceae bacterium]
MSHPNQSNLLPPAVSVILPVFNGERYLEECIRSVLTQTLTNFELLIGDDCSQDRSGEIARRFSDPRVHLFRRETNYGLFKNLNDLAGRASAPVIRFLCQDDAIEPDCLERESAIFAREPAVAMSFCKCRIVDAEGGIVSQCALRDLPDLIEPGLALQMFLYHGCMPGNLSTVSVRKDAFCRVGGFDETLSVSGDYDLWVRLCAQGQLAVVHELLVRLRWHPGQLSRAKPSRLAFLREGRRVRARLMSLLPETVQRNARWYVRRRQDVLDTHCCIRSGLEGRLRDCSRMIGEMGPRDLLPGLVFWCLTANNHLWKPRPKFCQ